MSNVSIHAIRLAVPQHSARNACSDIKNPFIALCLRRLAITFLVQEALHAAAAIIATAAPGLTATQEKCSLFAVAEQ